MDKHWALKVMLFVGIFALMTAAIWLFQVVSFEKSAIKVAGVVKSVELSFDSEGDPTYNPIIEFQDSSGQVRTLTTFTSFDASAYNPGDTVEVLYPFERPDRALLKDWGELYLLPGMLALLALLDLMAWFLVSRFIVLKKDLPELSQMQELMKR
jgi:hypothetical protein